MNFETIKEYLLSCFLLTLPIMVWNIVLTDKLPEAFQPAIFWKDIPAFLSYGENISRIIVFMLTILMPLKIVTPAQKRGLFLYAGGLIVYFSSWLVLIYYPDSAWSNSILGFTAPAYTPIFWLIAIGLIANSFYFKLPYRRWIFIAISLIFLMFHNIHAFMIYFRTH